MNRTKRKIFEKGYDGTSIEEITSAVGVAKGTLYYHFSSKEEIFNFLIEEGMNLLKNSIKIKIDKQNKYIDKIKAIVLIQIKIIVKYENFMTIVLSEIWGNSPRSNTCKKYLTEYLACSSLLQKKTKEIKVDELFKDLDKSYVQSLKIVKP